MKIVKAFMDNKTKILLIGKWTETDFEWALGYRTGNMKVEEVISWIILSWLLVANRSPQDEGAVGGPKQYIQKYII